jgi:hypothetical protein
MKTLDQRIIDLEKLLDKNQNHEVALNIISKLRKSNEEASNSEYTKQELHDLIFANNDCLATPGATNMPKEMLGEIKNLQEEIVDAYGMQD